MDPAQNIQATPAKVTIWNRNFICALIANFALVIAHFSVNTLVATYATYLGAAPFVMGVLTGMFFAISLAVRPVSGPMITKIDKRKLMIAVYILGGVVNLGYALFQSIPFFIFFRILNGVQYSFVGSLIMTVAGDSLPREKMASGMGIYGVGGAVGMAIGPFLSSSLLDFGMATLKSEDLGFSFVFLFAAVMLSLAVIPSALMNPDKKTKAEIASTGAWYKNITSVHAIPTTVVMFFILIGYSLYNSYINNFGEQQNISNISLFYLVMAGTLVLSRPLSGVLTDKFGVAKVVIPGLALFAVSFFIIGTSTSLETVLVGAVIAAIGVGSTQPAIQAMCIQSESALKRSVASNTIYIGMDLGFFLGPVMGGIVVDQTKQFSNVFKVGVIPIVLALICFIIILPIYKRRRAELEKVET